MAIACVFIFMSILSQFMFVCKYCWLQSFVLALLKELVDGLTDQTIVSEILTVDLARDFI